MVSTIVTILFPEHCGPRGLLSSEDIRYRHKVEQRVKNVIVFSANSVQYAIELGWVREVFTLGHVTPVPHAPKAIAGVVNFRGSLLSIIDVRSMNPNSPGASAVAFEGESALLLEVKRNQAALRVGVIDEVSSLRDSVRDGYLIDSRTREVRLLRPEDIFVAAQNGQFLDIESSERA